MSATVVAKRQKGEWHLDVLVGTELHGVRKRDVRKRDVRKCDVRNESVSILGRGFGIIWWNNWFGSRGKCDVTLRAASWRPVNNAGRSYIQVLTVP